MTKEELVSIFEAVPTEMLQDDLEGRLKVSLDEVTAKYPQDTDAKKLVALAIRATMDYNKEFMFRVLCKALTKD